MKLLLVADAHANWPALRAVAEREGDADAIVSLGDLVINGPQPAECVRWTRDRCAWSVIGNHEEKLLAVHDGVEHGVGSRARVLAALHAGLLADHELDYLRALPVVQRFSFGGATFTVTHGSLSGGTVGSLTAGLSPLLLRRELDLARTDYLIVGHTHWPLVRSYRGMTLLNPGAVGQPRDGDPRAQYAVWEDGRVELRRVEFDVEETIAALAANGCPSAYLAELADGWRGGLNPSALD